MTSPASKAVTAVTVSILIAPRGIENFKGGTAKLFVVVRSSSYLPGSTELHYVCDPRNLRVRILNLVTELPDGVVQFRIRKIDESESRAFNVCRLRGTKLPVRP